MRLLAFVTLVALTTYGDTKPQENLKDQCVDIYRAGGCVILSLRDVMSGHPHIDKEAFRKCEAVATVCHQKDCGQ
jgi:hypothetical protein